MYGDDEEDENVSPIEGASGGGFDNPSGFEQWPSLRQPRGHWASTLKRNPQKKPPGAASPASQDEIRWGDKRRFDITVPNLATGTFGLLDRFVQIVQIERPARVWSLLYSVELLAGGGAGVAGEEAIAFFSVYLGVGSSRIRIARNINIPFPAVPVFPQYGVESSVIDPALAASQIVIEVNAAVTVPVGVAGNRVFNLEVRAHGAPVFRG